MNKENLAKYISLSPEDCSGNESCARLNEENESARRKIILLHMKNGVHFPLCDGVLISPDSEIGEGTVIMPGTILEGSVKIGKDCVIGPNTYIENSVIGSGCTINSSQCRQALVKDNAQIGPFAHIRPNSVIGDSVRMGNFTEIKNSVIGNGAKISHLTYVGDADVGAKANFGCGCATVNFDGKDKFRTTIGEHAFIGCNSSLVAPVSLGDCAYVAAGSVIIEDIPENSLAIARSRQVNKEGWVVKKKPYKDMQD